MQYYQLNLSAYVHSPTVPKDIFKDLGDIGKWHLKSIKFRKGTTMAFLTFTDKKETCSALVFVRFIVGSRRKTMIRETIEYELGLL